MHDIENALQLTGQVVEECSSKTQIVAEDIINILKEKCDKKARLLNKRAAVSSNR